MNNGLEPFRLSEVCEIRPPKAEARAILDEDDSVSFLPMEDLGVFQKEIVAVKQRKLKDVVGSYTYFANNDVLLAKITPCFENGKLGIAKNLTNGVGFGSSEYIVFRPDERLLPEYLFYFLSLDEFREEGKRKMLGSVGHKRVSLEFIENTKIPAPPIEEQSRIVAILDEAFAAIDKAKANTEKNIQNARELFDSYLNNIFSNPGPDWRLRTLEEISINFGRGKSRHRPRNAAHLYGGKYPFVQTGDIRNADHVITQYSQTYSEDGLAQSKLWPKGTICITIAANIAETAILGFDACFPDSIIGVQPKPDQADVGFIEYLLQSFKVKIKAMGKGSAQDNINMGTFENERFPFPRVAEQNRIVGRLDSLSDETNRLESIHMRRIDELDELKKSILQKAFRLRD